MSPGPRPVSLPSGILDPSSCLTTTDTGQKLGLCLSEGGAGSPCNAMWPGPRPTSVPSGIFDPSSCLATTDIGRKWGWLCPLFCGGELGPRLTQCRLGRGLPPYQVASWSIQPKISYISLILTEVLCGWICTKVCTAVGVTNVSTYDKVLGNQLSGVSFNGVTFCPFT